MTRDEYVNWVRDLLSQDPPRVRAANRALYARTVTAGAPAQVQADTDRDADLALAEVAA